MNEAEKIIERVHQIAAQHYPDDRAGQAEFIILLLQSKLREVLYRAPALPVYTEARLKGMAEAGEVPNV